MQGKKHYQEKLFIKFQLSDHIPADNLYRRLNKLIDFNFLYKETAQYYGTAGQKSIDPVVFMKLILAGYLENLNSDRRIINALGLRLDIRYFVGYDLDEPLPWHSTLSRTRKLYSQDVFMQLFKRVLEQCIDKGMISGKRQAVDSVFIKANASTESMLRKGIMADAVVYGEELEANAAENEPQQEDKDKPDTGKTADAPDTMEVSYNPGYKAVKKGMQKVKSETHYSPIDPDSRLSMKKGKPLALNYLGQVCVDTTSHVITYVQAFKADKRDSECLPALLLRMTANLNKHHIEVKELLADTNYSSGTSLKALQSMGITGYIPNIGGYKFERENFTYHAQGDYYECRNGEKLTLQGIYDGDKRYTRTQKNCEGCPFKKNCIGDKREIALTESIDKPYYDQMHLRMQTREAKRAKLKRQSTVEPVIGSLVGYYGIKKVNSKGIDQANKCLTMAAVAYNLKKILKYAVKGIKAPIYAINKDISRIVKHFNPVLSEAVTFLKIRTNNQINYIFF